MSRKNPEILSHWYFLMEDFNTSALEFYKSVEQALARRNVPNLKFVRIDCQEGGLLSAKREYLRVQRKEFVFDICGAPFGNGFFVSWWLGEIPSGLAAICYALSAIPIVGIFFALLLRLMVRPLTYYKMDTALMFQESVRTAVVEVIEEMRTQKGLRVLSPVEIAPRLKKLAA